MVADDGNEDEPGDGDRRGTKVTAKVKVVRLCQRSEEGRKVPPFGSTHQANVSCDKKLHELHCWKLTGVFHRCDERMIKIAQTAEAPEVVGRSPGFPVDGRPR